MMKDTITIEHAYKAMYLYLKELYEMTQSDDLAGFLGSMSMLDDGKPVDAAIWSDWLEAIDKSRFNTDTNLDLRPYSNND